MAGARKLIEDSGVQCSARRVFRVRYASDGARHIAQVGEIAEMADGSRIRVGAIFDGDDSYVICPAVGMKLQQVPKDGAEAQEFDPA